MQNESKDGPPQQPERNKPGPREKLFTLYPFTFEQAVERATKFRTKPIPKRKKKRPNA